MIRDESLGIRKGFTRESHKKIPVVPVTVRLSREPWWVLRGGPGGKSEKNITTVATRPKSGEALLEL